MAIRSIFIHALLISSLLGFESSALAQEAPAETPVVQDQVIPKVQVSTLFDVKALVPGQMAHLVVVLDVPKDWHIYWMNSGGRGVPTALSVTGPEGWKLGDVRYPGPVLHKDKKGAVSYVLRGQVAFFVPIIPPDDAKIGQQVQFNVNVNWMQTKGSSHKDHKLERVSIKVAGGLPSRNSGRKIAALRSYLPRRGMGPTGIGVSLSGDSKQGDLTFESLDARDFDFFAHPDSPMHVVDRNSESKSADRSVRNFHLASVEGKAPEEIEVHGVMRVKIKERVLYYEVKYKGVLTLAPVKPKAGHGTLPVLPKK